MQNSFNNRRKFRKSIPKMFKNLKVEEALAYLDRVKCALTDKPDMYSTFLDVMNDFKSQRIGTTGVVYRIKNLFKHFPDLLVGFNAFMPMDNKIELFSEGQDFLNLKDNLQTDSIIVSDLNRTLVPENGEYGEESEQNLIYDSCVCFLNKVQKCFPDGSAIFNNFLRIIYRCLMELGDSTEAIETDKICAFAKRLFGPESNLVNETIEMFPKMVLSSKFLMKYIELAIDVSPLISYDYKEPSTSLDDRSSEYCSTSTKRRKRPHDVSPSLTATHKLRRIDENCDAYDKFSNNYVKLSNETVLNGSYEEYLFFDKVRKALNDEEVYRNFLRCLYLYNQNLITKSELMHLLTPFFGKFPKLVKWLRQFLNCDEFVGYEEILNPNDYSLVKRSNELNVEIDYSSCKRLGVSYRELPKNFILPKCTGRTTLCNEVLNNTCVSFPSWQSEDSSVVSSKKTQHEECIYRTEDERFELDIVIEVNKAAIQALESVFKRMNRMNVNDAKRFQLDSFLGGRSQVIQQRAIKRVYGDKSSDIVDGLTRNPFVAVPLVLNRLKAKEKEWKEAQISFNRVWREQNEKSYWKSLDQQGNAFKQNDLKLIRSKTLINQIEILLDERRQGSEQNLFSNRNDGPLMQLVYPRDRRVFIDANDILFHSVQRQTSLNKNDASKIKTFLNEFFPSLLGAEFESTPSDNDEEKLSGYVLNGRAQPKMKPVKIRSDTKCLRSSTSGNPSHTIANGKLKERFTFGRSLLYLPESWYVFIRLHHIFVERLAKLKSLADDSVRSEKFNLENLSSSTYDLNKIRPKAVSYQTKDFYSTLIKQIKSLLDGEMDNTQYEDNLRYSLAADCHLAFTFDKIVQNCVKQVQAIVSDEISMESQILFNSWRSSQSFLSKRSQNVIDAQYAADAKNIFEGQNCFKTYFYDDGKVAFDLLPPPTLYEKSKTVAVDFLASHRWSTFVESHLNDDIIPPLAGENGDIADAASKPVYLPRNVRKFRKRTNGDVTKDCDSCNSSNDDVNLRIYENLQALLTNKRRRSLYYVAGTMDFMFRKKTSSNSNESFLRSVDVRNRRFCDWHESWLISNVNLTEARSVADWFVEGKLDEVSLNNSLKIQRTTESCPQRPPFCVVNRYLSSSTRKQPKIIMEIS